MPLVPYIIGSGSRLIEDCRVDLVHSPYKEGSICLDDPTHSCTCFSSASTCPPETDTPPQGPTVTDHTADIVLEIFGQQDSTGFQTPFLFCYALPDSVDFNSVEQKLQDGLYKLAAAFPWVAGNIINENRTESDSGIFKIRTSRATPSLVIKDHRDDASVASLLAMEESGFPISFLDEGMFSPLYVNP